MYYILTNIGGQVFRERFFTNALFYRDEEEGRQAELEIGVISPVKEGLEERLKVFADLVENMVKSSLDGRKTRHLSFRWSELKPRVLAIDRILRAEETQSGTQFTPAELTSEAIIAAQILSNKPYRETLIELSRAGFVRERDILGRKNKTHDDVRDSINKLRESGLLSAEYLLECKRTATPLTRLKDPSQLEVPEVKNLVCPSCNSTFSQEAISEGYSLSELGRQMSRQSHWMTIWVTDLLLKLGVPQGSILWNVSEDGGEVDLLVSLLEQLWIFELKDREFGAGDAYPLNYRQVRYKANKAIIITTEKVSRDAKRVFEELAREARRPEQSGLVYVEGLDSAEKILRDEISKAALRYARQRLALISELSGYDFGRVLMARLGISPEPPQDEDIVPIPF